jgi:hypothetical protein
MPDRRRHFRRTFDSLEYFQASANNGGFLLDLSEGGLSAQLSRPADELDIFQFTMYLNQDSRIDAAGQVAWRNPAGTVVGLRFLELSCDVRRLIRESICEETSGAKGRLSATHPIVDKPIAVLETPEKVGWEPRSKPRVPGPQLVVPAAPPPSGNLPSSLLSPPYFGLEETSAQDRFVPFSAPAIAATPPIVLKRREPALDSFRAEWERRLPLLNRFWIGSASILIVCLVIVASLLFHKGPRVAPAGTGIPPPAILQHEPVAAAAPSPVNMGNPADDAGERAYSEGMRYLQGLDGFPDSAAAAESFWNAVTNGNIPAEVALARLYLQGEGVSKNCDQANILLQAAARKGNADAGQLLQSLVTDPCH